MMLIGMYDSPYTRRVAVSMDLMSMPFEHRDWSVGKDFDRIRAFNPLGRVPTLVLDSGEVLIESAMILDWLDRQAGARALLPAEGESRTRALHLIALATGAVDKGVQLVYERVFRPAEKRHAPWQRRCETQMRGALDALEAHCAKARTEWLAGDRLSQADITAACHFTYLTEAVSLDPAAWPALQARTARCEALPEFRNRYAPFVAPDCAPARRTQHGSREGPE